MTVGPRGGPAPPVVVRPEGDAGAAIPGAGMLGLKLFLASLTMLFGSGLVAYLAVRLRADSWRPAGVPFPWIGLAMATLVLAAESVTIQSALGAIRHGHGERLVRRLGLALLLAAAFLGVQAWNWTALWYTGVLSVPNLYGFTFLMLTGLHALHVVGGIVGLSVVAYRASRGAYTWAHYPGVRYSTIYWHFLGLTWIAVLATLIAGS